MPKIVSFLVFFVFTHTAVFSQTREELEKQRVELKKEIEQTEKLLHDNKTKTKENLLQWNLINNKVSLQNRVVDNSTKTLDCSIIIFIPFKKMLISTTDCWIP